AQIFPRLPLRAQLLPGRDSTLRSDSPARYILPAALSGREPGKCIVERERPREMSASPLVGVVLGSDSDLDVMRPAIDALREFGIEFELRVLSAHRTPLETLDFARSAAERGLRVIIAGAGAAAALPGALAGATSLPVIGVPIAATTLGGLD